MKSTRIMVILAAAILSMGISVTSAYGQQIDLQPTSSKALATTSKTETARQVLSHYADGYIYDIRYLNKAKTKAVAITAYGKSDDEALPVYDSGELWYVCNGKAQQLFAGNFIGCLKSYFKLYRVKRGWICSIESETYVISSTSSMWFLKGATAKRLPSVGGNFTKTAANRFEAYHSTYDAFGKGGGHTYKHYYYKWTGTRLVEYGGKLITQRQLMQAKKGAKILRAISKRGRIGKIYYRANGIINVNYSTGTGTSKVYSNVTLRYKKGTLHYAKVNTYGSLAIDRATDSGKYKKRKPGNTGKVAVLYPKTLPSRLR